MDLNIIWFILITVLFAGFFLLEGFDYGVGILAPLVGKDAEERRLVQHTILPVWDGNEVWMITAGGALFAAFPHVYATLFSAFYLPLFLLLVALIMRGAGLELRNRETCPHWHRFWDWSIAIGSLVPALLWGVTVANLLVGIRINADKIFIGSMFDLVSVYTLVGGLAFALVFTFHGASFLLLRLYHSNLEKNILEHGKKIGILAILAYALFLVLTIMNTDILSMTVSLLIFVAAAAVFIFGYYSFLKEKTVLAFSMTSLAIVLTTVGVFSTLFPNILISTMNPLYSLDIYNSASSPYTLTIMTIAAVTLVPVVLAYQAWTYYVFRKRVSATEANH